MNLFWYPAIHYNKWFDGKFDKPSMLDSYVRYFLARLQSMFKYDGLPETIPAKWLEHYLLCNGNALIAKVDDDLYALTGGMGGEPDPYYIPSRYIVANPYLDNLTKSYKIDDDAVLIYNDTYSQGVLPMLQRYCTQLVENDITLQLADILARATINISAADDKTKASAEIYLKRLRDGDLAVLSEQAFIEGLNVREFSKAAESLTDLIEYHQYIKASLYNELGLNSNYNMKRESINSNESQLNDDMLHPLIDNMLAERRAGIEKVNTMFGTNISVDFNSAWLENEKEEQMLFDMPGQSEDVENIETPEDGDMKIYPDDAPEDNIIPEDDQLADASELLVDAVEEITQVIEAEAEEIIDNIEGVNDDV